MEFFILATIIPLTILLVGAFIFIRYMTKDVRAHIKQERKM